MVPIWNMKARQGDVAALGRAERVAARSRAQQRARRRREPQVDPACRASPASSSGCWRCQPPAYPYDDRQGARRRRARASTTSSARSATRPAATRTGTVVPVEEVGTDRHRLDMWTPAAAGGLQQLHRRLRLGLHRIPQDQRLRGGAARRRVAARAVSAQRFGAVAAGAVRAGVRASLDVLSRLQRLRSRSRRLRLGRRQRQARRDACTTRACPATATRVISTESS